MSVEASREDDGRTLVLAVRDRFLFDVYNDFRSAYIGFTQSGGRIRVNLSAATYMDSAALGILMLLRDHARTHNQDVTLEAASPVIRRVLEIASFDRLFNIA